MLQHKECWLSVYLLDVCVKAFTTISGDLMTVSSRRPSMDLLSGQGSGLDRDKREDSDVQDGRLSVFVHRRDDQSSHDVIQPLLRWGCGLKVRLWNESEAVKWKWGCGLKARLWNESEAVEWKSNCGMKVRLWNGSETVEWKSDCEMKVKLLNESEAVE